MHFMEKNLYFTKVKFDYLWSRDRRNSVSWDARYIAFSLLARKGPNHLKEAWGATKAQYFVNVNPSFIFEKQRKVKLWKLSGIS